MIALLSTPFLIKWPFTSENGSESVHCFSSFCLKGRRKLVGREERLTGGSSLTSVEQAATLQARPGRGRPVGGQRSPCPRAVLRLSKESSRRAHPASLRAPRVLGPPGGASRRGQASQELRVQGTGVGVGVLGAEPRALQPMAVPEAPEAEKSGQKQREEERGHHAFLWAAVGPPRLPPPWSQSLAVPPHVTFLLLSQQPAVGRGAGQGQGPAPRDCHLLTPPGARDPLASTSPGPGSPPLALDQQPRGPAHRLPASSPARPLPSTPVLTCCAKPPRARHVPECPVPSASVPPTPGSPRALPAAHLGCSPSSSSSRATGPGPGSFAPSGAAPLLAASLAGPPGPGPGPCCPLWVPSITAGPPSITARLPASQPGPQHHSRAFL